MFIEPFAATVALRERDLVVARLFELALEPESSWRDGEIDDLRIFLVELDRMVARHRTQANLRH